MVLSVCGGGGGGERTRRTFPPSVRACCQTCTKPVRTFIYTVQSFICAMYWLLNTTSKLKRSRYLSIYNWGAISIFSLPKCHSSLFFTIPPLLNTTCLVFIILTSRCHILQYVNETFIIFCSLPTVSLPTLIWSACNKIIWLLKSSFIHVYIFYT